MTPTTAYEVAPTASSLSIGATERHEIRTTNIAKGKILVVDDEPEIVHALSLRLKKAGYEVITAHDGVSATKAAIQEQPDLVILDIGLPCGDGHVIAQRLAENVKTMFVPIIFLTARTEVLDRFKAMQVGAADYITKPYTSEQILESVDRALNPPGGMAGGAANSGPLFG